MRELSPVVEFYESVLARSPTERVGEHHHDLALQAVGAIAGGSRSEPGSGPNRSVGLYHAAIEVPTAEALAATDDRLREEGVGVSPWTTASAGRRTSRTRTETGWRCTSTPASQA